MTYSISVTSSGQMTLPKELRKYLGISTGSKVNVELEGNKVVIRKKLSPEEVAAEIDARMSDEAKENIKTYGGKPFDKIREELYLKKDKKIDKYYKEKYEL